MEVRSELSLEAEESPASESRKGRGAFREKRGVYVCVRQMGGEGEREGMNMAHSRDLKKTRKVRVPEKRN